MKTDDLITMIANQAGPAEKVSVAHRLVPAGVVGGVLAALVVLGILGLIPESMLTESGPWIKIGYAIALTLVASKLFARLSKPGASETGAVLGLASVVFVMMLAGLFSYWFTPETERKAALLGHSWLVCPWAILGLSLPVMACSFWAMKGFAPTKLALAGAACGLFSGSVAALAYAFACTEPATPFIAVWYTLGVALCGGIGAFLGPRLLRW